MQQQIEAYFGESLKECSVYVTPDVSGNDLSLIIAEITYENFKPERTVRRFLEDKFERLQILSLTRLYSDESREQALEQMKAKFEGISLEVVREEDFICEVEAYLYDKEL